MWKLVTSQNYPLLDFSIFFARCTLYMQEFGQELAEVQAAAAAAACDMLDSPLKTQREDEDATRWVEDHPYVDVKHVNP